MTLHFSSPCSSMLNGPRLRGGETSAAQRRSRTTPRGAAPRPYPLVARCSEEEAQGHFTYAPSLSYSPAEMQIPLCGRGITNGYAVLSPLREVARSPRARPARGRWASPTRPAPRWSDHQRHLPIAPATPPTPAPGRVVGRLRGPRRCRRSTWRARSARAPKSSPPVADLEPAVAAGETATLDEHGESHVISEVTNPL